VLAVAAIQAEAPGRFQCQASAHQCVRLRGIRLPGVVQEQCKVQDEWSFQALEYFSVLGQWQRLGGPDFIQLLDASERVFIGRILVIKLMLHQTGEPAKFRNEFAEESHIVHGPQCSGHIAALVEDFPECLVRVGIAEKRPVYEPDLIAHELGQIGIERQSTLLRQQKRPDQPSRLIPEDAG